MPNSSLADRYTVVAGIASAVERYARSHGIDIGPICKAIGIDPASFSSLTARVSLDRLCRLLEACALLANDEAFGLKCADAFTPGATGPFGYGLMAAPTLADLAGFLEAHTQYATHTDYFKKIDTGDGLRLEWGFAPIIVKRDQYADMALALLFQRLRAIAGDACFQITLEMERPRPRQAGVFRERLTRQLAFGCDGNRLFIPAALLDIRNPRGDATLFSLMDAQCRALRPGHPLPKRAFVEQVREYLALRVSEPVLQLSDIARYFGVSERTFQRRLAEHGTSLHALRDETRRDLSLQLLQDSELSITEIGYRLGYSAPSAFTRSVSRWFGETPRDMRLRRGA